NLPLLFSLLLSSSTAFQCLHGINKSSTVIECNTFCYSEFGVTSHSSALLNRGCSRERPIHEKLIYLVKFQVMLEDKECSENGIFHISPLNRSLRRERICCNYQKCNGLRKEMDVNSIHFLYFVTPVSLIAIRWLSL
ncbi:hypothetical protein PENTCL1PPCAC_17666, partial [Pristionchus entomophagus]